jgi:hypothetical protein
MRLASTYIMGLWTLYVTTLHRGDGEHGRRSDWQDAGAALPREQACYSLDRLLRRVGYICAL